MKKLGLFFLALALIAISVWFFHRKNSQTLKIGFVTDWEYNQAESSEKAHFQAKELLSEAVAYFNYIFKPTVVIGGGDFIKNNEIKKIEANLLNLREVIAIFDKNKAEKLYVLGKKDYQKESLEEVKQVLKLEKTYYSQSFKEIKLIILDTTQNDSPETSIGTIEEDQIKWLKNELAQTQSAIIFSHHSLIKTPVKDIWRKNLTNQDEVQEIIKKNHKKIIGLFSGNNNNQDYITKKSGIPYINIAGLTNEETLGRFSKITITKDKKQPLLFKIKLDNRGKNSSVYEIKRDLKLSTATRINSIQKNLIFENKKWTDLASKDYPQGIVGSSPSGEPNLNVTKSETVVVAYENKEKDGKIQVKVHKNNNWQNLSDENHPEGLISLGKGNNPRIATKNEDIFIIFTEADYNNRSRLLKWNNSADHWEELSTEGFVSEKSSHESTLIFDKNKENLYIAYSEEIAPNSKRYQIKIKKWNDQTWTEIKTPFLSLAGFQNSSLDEIELKTSKIDNSIYLAYEEQTFNNRHIVKVKKLTNSTWEDLKMDEIYSNQITQTNGFSPSLVIDNQENVYLSFVENNQDKIHVYKYNQEKWLNISPSNQTGTAIEPFITISEKGILYLGYSEFKENIVMFKESEKDFIETSAWRIRIQKFENSRWSDCEDDFNYGGYVTKGSGKGDPALKTYQENLYIVVSDEENNYAARVKKYTD